MFQVHCHICRINSLIVGDKRDFCDVWDSCDTCDIQFYIPGYILYHDVQTQVSEAAWKHRVHNSKTLVDILGLDAGDELLFKLADGNK